MNTQNQLSLAKRIDIIHETMFESFGHYYIKDLSGSYLYLNKNQLHDAGSSNMSDFLGKDDFSPNIPWNKHAFILKKNDALAIHEKKAISALEIMTTHDKQTYIMLSSKKPFYHNGDIVGTCGVSLEAPNALTTPNTSFSPESVFFDMTLNKILRLTTKQRPVAYYLLQGLSAEEIAQKLFLTKSTIDYHIESIKKLSQHQSIRGLLLNIRMI